MLDGLTTIIRCPGNLCANILAVFSQIMFELSTANLPPDAASFSSKIKSVYWLDAGHNGRKDTWITNDFVLQKIVSTNIQLFIHVTPYQVKDLNRPWVGKEKKKFIQKLKSFHANFKSLVIHVSFRPL
jgi:hypothetical protein